MTPFERPAVGGRPSLVALLYLAAAIVMTWPLVAVMDRRIAGDMGDPLFNCWILLWTGGQVLQLLGGNLSALSQYWHANIFYPAPLTLAYSEHLTPQMLQVLPILGATNNVILAYNVLLLTTFVLCGLGMYLLVLELTGQPLAAFLAGLAYAFAPYRFDQYSHIQVLSSQWMPFVLYGLRRFFVSGRLRPLLGGAGAFVAQALSCQYYLAYFAPFAAAYCLYEMIGRGKLGDGRVWRMLFGVSAAALFVIGLFLWPYFSVRQGGGLGFREVSRVQSYAFDTNAFATISEHSRLWGDVIRAWPRAEGDGFPGFTVLAFAVIAIGVGLAGAVIQARRANNGATGWRRVLIAVLMVMLALMLYALVDILVNGEVVHTLATPFARQRNAATYLLGDMAIAGGALLVLSARARGVVRSTLTSPHGFFAGAAVTAAWLSLGPMMHAKGIAIGPGVYDLFYRWAPGFDGLRVPSRYSMLVSLFLSVLAGLGSAALVARWRRVGQVVLVLGMVATVAEGWNVPTDTNVRFKGAGLAWPPAEIADAQRLTPMYRLIRAMPAATVLAEFPFGDTANEIRFVFYSGYHRKPIVNGYSGFYPESYQRILEPLTKMPASEEAWQALVSSLATHALVHEGAYLDRDGREISAWLRRHGAQEVADLHPDHLFQLRK